MEKKQDFIPVVLISVQTPDMQDSDVSRSNREMSMLLADLGMAVVETVVQKRENKDSPSYLGAGKLKDAAKITGGCGVVVKGPEKVELVDLNMRAVIDDEISAGQQRNLQSALGVEVMDRVSVILQIFERRANSKEAKLQVELAKLEYQLPRVKDDHSLGDKEGGGGRASRGHTNVELAKQRIRHNIAELKRAIDSVTSEVKSVPDFTVALVGYTNAGKSSIMQALTNEGVYVEDKLFATLGTTTRRISPPAVPPIFVTDTVGFLERLPHGLIASFRSTLSEARHAWVVLQIIDVSDDDWRNHISVTSEALKGVDMSEIPCWLVFNKIDRLSSDKLSQIRAEYPDALFVSALSKIDMSTLRAKLIGLQDEGLLKCQLTLSYAQYPVLAEFRSYVQVIEEDYSEEVRVLVKSTEDVINKLKSKIKRH